LLAGVGLRFFLIWGVVGVVGAVGGGVVCWVVCSFVV